jgi:aldose 1-epimerase
MRAARAVAKKTMEASSRVFGKLPDGRAVEAFMLRNAAGLSVEVTTYGATVLSVRVPPPRGGPAEEVTLCHASLESLRAASPYFGATIGRVANRVAKGAYVVDGVARRGVVNNGANHLHGGAVGFDKVLWAPRVYVTPAAAGVEFSYVSPDGEEGYPGTLAVTADYRLTADNELRMEFTATTDAPTPVNICNHTYWNLSGGLKTGIHDHTLQLFAPFYTPSDATQIPTGVVAPTAGTHFDFAAPTRIGERIMGVDGGGAPGYDHNFVRSAEAARAGLAHGLSPIAVAHDPKSGRTMTVSTNAPGVQFYTVRRASAVRPPANATAPIRHPTLPVLPPLAGQLA